MVSLGLDVAEGHGTLYSLGSTYVPENDAIYDGLSRSGVRLVSLAGILKHGVFPLGKALTFLLGIGETAFSCPVEIEFAVLDYCGISQPAFWEGYGQRRDWSAEARVRNVFYFLYELQKYIVIRAGRNHDPASARSYKRQVMEIVETALARSALDHFNSVLDVLEEEEPLVDAEIERLVAERQKAREAKDYARADAIRDELARRGIILEDTPQGVRIRRKAGPPRA